MDPDSDAESLLSTSVEKHGRHFKQFNQFLDYVILYADMSKVLHLPGSSTPFTLEKYKEDILKPYSKLNFWLCEKKEFENSTWSDSDDEDLLVSAIQTSSSSMDQESSLTTGNSGRVSLTASASTSDTSCSSSESNATAMPSSSSMHQCPTCFVHYKMEEIEAHADACATAWVDPIGSIPPIYNIPSEDEENEKDDEPEKQDDNDMGQIHEAINKIRTVIGSEITNRISIRRSSAFQDYVAARKKKWFHLKGSLKVTFIGEPAVDEGGPRREFFTGVCL